MTDSSTSDFVLPPLSNPEPYTYLSLKGSDEIRLIRFRRSNRNIEIFHTPIQSAPSYRALSYPWGEDTNYEV